MGFWPENSVGIPTRSGVPINVDLARDLGYSKSCIDLMQRLPYPDDRVVCNRGLYLLEDTYILDLRGEEDLRWGRHPEGTDFEESPNVEGSILTLMAPSSQEGSVVLLDVDIGIVYQYKTVYGPSTSTLKYRVQKHLDGDPDIKAPGYLDPFAYKYAPFVPATQYFRSLHEKYCSLHRLPFLGPRYENDVDADIEGEIGDESSRSYMRRRQAALSGLYRDIGWPSAQFDRHEFLNRWRVVEEEFRQEALRRIDEEEAEGNWFKFPRLVKLICVLSLLYSI